MPSRVFERHPQARFVTFEGPDGSGKSTQLAAFAKRLEAAGHSVLVTKNPGGTALGVEFRRLLLENPTQTQWHWQTELLTYMADRAQHVEEVLKPALAKPVWVLCDRFTDSTLAYQGYGRSLSHEWIHTLNQSVCQGITPDRVYVFEASATLLLERISANRERLDRLEQEGPAFLEAVRQGFIQIAQEHPQTHRCLDATLSIEALSELVWQDVQQSFL
jgi:dTMP kinase